MLDKIYKLNKNVQTGRIDFSPLYKDLYLKRLGSIQSYTDRGEIYLTEGYQNNPIVYSIVNLTSMLASRAKWYCRGYNGEEVNIPELATLMMRPTVDKSWRDYIQDITTQHMYSGNAFSAVSRFSNNSASNLKGKPSELFMMPSNEIQIWLKNGKGTIEQYVLDFQGATLNPERGVKAKDVGHWHKPNPDYSIEGDFLWGQPSLRAARRSIQTYNETLDAGVWYQQNKGIESILVNQDPDLELGPETIDQLKNKLRLQGQGPENAGNIPIIDANLGVLNVGSTPEDIKLLPLRIQAAKEICNVFNFPTKLLGLDDSTYQNGKEATKALWSNCVIPELDEIKDGLNRWLVPMYGAGFYLDYDLSDIDALQEDKLTRGEAITKFAGFITMNEARDKAGMMTYDWMKKPTNMEEFKKQQYVGFIQSSISDNDSGLYDGGSPEEKPNTNENKKK